MFGLIFIQEIVLKWFNKIQGVRFYLSKLKHHIY